MNKKVEIKKISVAAVFCALAYASVYVFHIKVMFLTFDAKDAIIGLASLLLGPVYGIISAALVTFLEFISISDTGVYGLIMNFLSTGTFALCCGMIYKYNRTFRGAIIAVVMSVISVTSVMMLANLFITPLFMKTDRGEVVKMIPTLLLPFNLAKASMSAAITLILYKPLSSGLKKANLLPFDKEQKYRFGIRSILVTVCGLIVIALAITVLIVYLNGNFELVAQR